MKYIFFIFFLLLFPLIYCNPFQRFKRSKPAEAQPKSINGSNATQLFNPFGHMDIDHHKIYLIGAAFVILFVFIKLGSETEFNYCFFVGFRDCVYARHSNFKNPCRKTCIKHVTTPGNIFPESAFLVTSGIIPAAVLLGIGVKLDGALDPTIVFNFLLIPIILTAGWNTDKITFYKNIGTILWFAIIGTIVNAAILMPFFYYGSKSRWGLFNIIDMDLVNSGLYAILICAVDPVAVLSVFEAMHIDKLVYGVVFGESLLNDGVAVVFYQAFNGMSEYNNLLFFESIGIVFVFFCYAFSISVLLAVVMAVFISLTSKLFYHHQPMQFVVILSMNYMTYIIGDSIKGSGILSLYFCVLLQRQYVQANLTITTNTIVTQMLNQLALLSEGVIFILMGLTSFSPTGISTHTDIGFSLFLIFICYTSRYLVVYTLGFIANQFRNEKLDYKRNLFIQSHGGLRGAIGFSLALTIDSRFPNKYYYQSATAIMVFFSVYILGATIKPLVNFCKIPLESHDEKTVFESLQDKVLDRTKDGIKAILGFTSMRFRWEKEYRHINNRYLKRWLMASKAIERNVSHSSVVKLYHQQSISEAQSIAKSHGSILIKDALKSNGDARLRMYKRAWNSYISLDSFKANGSVINEMYSNMSIPDMSMLDKVITRRDVDDQMTHHNRQDGIGKKLKKSDLTIIDQKALKIKLKHNSCSYKSPHYKHSARVYGIKHRDKNNEDGNILEKMQKTFNTTPKMNKSVTFEGTFISMKKPLFNFDDIDKPSPDISDNNKVVFSISEDKISDQAYSNVAYNFDDDPLLWSARKRHQSTCDPFLGRFDDSTVTNFELPWQRINDHTTPERSHEPIIPGMKSEQVPHHMLIPNNTESKMGRRKSSVLNGSSLSTDNIHRKVSYDYNGLPKIIIHNSRM